MSETLDKNLFNLPDFEGLANLLPKVNFRRVKLGKFENLENKLSSKNLTSITFDDSILNIPKSENTSSSEEITDESNFSPLRKKSNKDVTFNLEAEIVQDESNLILSPGMVSLPPFHEDSLSHSNTSTSYIWPPITNKKEKTKVQKTKPYFLQSENIEEKIENASTPWVEENISTLEELPPKEPSTLEKELIEETKVFNETPSPTLKAIQPGLRKEIETEINNFNFSSEITESSIKLQEKDKQMLDNYSSNRSNQIKIIILGGLTITLAYLAWSYLIPSLKSSDISDLNNISTSENIVVRDLFSKENRGKPNSFLSDLFKLKHKKNSSQLNNVENEENNSLAENIIGSIRPISEQDRNSLIERAKLAVENRFDPFGQDEVLPPETLLKKKQAEEEAAKPAPDIQLKRKQIELVGVISTKEKNLALVNVYSAEYAVRPEDEDDERENKLKTALSMVTPERMEVSLLDPIEDWYVKQITKSKSKSDDPTIDLVKGDKKFKLRVGQKVLLPNENDLNDEDFE